MVLEQCSPVLLTGADLFVFNDIKYLSWSSVGMNRDCMLKYVTANELFFKKFLSVAWSGFNINAILKKLDFIFPCIPKSHTKLLTDLFPGCPSGAPGI